MFTANQLQLACSWGHYTKGRFGLSKDNDYMEFMITKNLMQKVQLSEKTGLHFWGGLA